MKCFVIMPFGNPKVDAKLSRKYDLIYSQWIKPTIESIGIPDKQMDKIYCHRADKELRPGEIITHIIENLTSADIVVADMTGRNPNVFYELGVRHAVSNNTILIAEELDDIPFDLRGLRTIPYQYDPENMLKFKDALMEAVKEIISEPKKIDNPVRRFLYNREVDKLMMHSTPPGYDVVRDVLSEMTSLRKEFASHVQEVRQIVELITSPQQSDMGRLKESKIGLKFFEGIWNSISSGSMFCAKVVNGHLLIPYSYANSSDLTGHYHNCILVGATLFARFDWFHSSISGYAFYKVKSEDVLVGGWWHGQGMPIEILKDVSKIDDSIPGMTKIILERERKPKKFPHWAQNYFEKIVSENGHVTVSY